MSVLFRGSFKTAITIFGRLFKVAIAMSNFMNKVYNERFAPEFGVSMLKETIALVQDYACDVISIKNSCFARFFCFRNLQSSCCNSILLCTLHYHMDDWNPNLSVLLSETVTSAAGKKVAR